MVQAIIIVVAVLVALVVGAVLGLFLRSTVVGKRLDSAKQEAGRALEEAEGKTRQMLLDAREESLQIRNQTEAELKERRREVQRQESRLVQREETLDKRNETLEKREQSLTGKEQQQQKALEEVATLKSQELTRLEGIASLSLADAQEQLFKRAEDEMKHELSRRYYELEQEMKETADQKARKIITLAVQRLASDVVSETTTTVVPLPNDEMKGRLIGREGRNIRALESLTGVDIIVDDTPEVVTISCFDPIRREVARLTLQKLIMDGRIHPARIEEMVERSQKEIEESVQQEGEKAVLEVGVRGLNPELVKLLGHLKYRYSYGENVLKHSTEVAHISGMLAAEIGANVQVAKTAGLLHDIGKAVSHEVEGPHAEIGAEMAKKYGIPPAIQLAIMEHHDEERGSLEAFVVAAADAISAARPGARKESLEHYVKRLEALEKVAMEFPGIERAYAIQAGREMRIAVQSDHVDDVGAANLARSIAKKVEESLVYPGQIKITVIRETRSVEYAR
ncbi:MAG: ribonuclease Y [Chloroflexota bacterium]|nr:ribonuclease Y [Chloroflexota bacterium]